MGPDLQQNVIHGTGSATVHMRSSWQQCSVVHGTGSATVHSVLDQIYLSLELDPQQFVVRVTGSATVVNSEVPVPQQCV